MNIPERFSLRDLLIFLLFPASQILLLHTRFFSEELETGASFWLLLLLCAAADAALAVAVRSVRKSAELRAEKESLDRQIKSQEEYSRSLAEHYEHMRALRHDLANHVYTVKILAGEGRTEEAAAYIDDLRAGGSSSENEVSPTSAAEGGTER